MQCEPWLSLVEPAASVLVRNGEERLSNSVSVDGLPTYHLDARNRVQADKRQAGSCHKRTANAVYHKVTLCIENLVRNVGAKEEGECVRETWDWGLRSRAGTLQVSQNQ
jgi:hypothetical protein